MMLINMVHRKKNNIRFGSYLGNIWYAQDRKFTSEELNNWRKHYGDPRIHQVFASDVKKWCLVS